MYKTKNITIEYMSGYKLDSNPSSLGGGVPGKVEMSFGNTLTGSDVALKRRILRKAFKTNKLKKNNKEISSMCGPFRSANQLGEPLTRKYASCGGCNQVNDTNSNVLNSSLGDGVSNKDCGLIVQEFTTTEVPLASGNNKYVSDSSEFTRFKHLKSVNLTYNDKSGGGDDHNASYSFLNNLRG